MEVYIILQLIHSQCINLASVHLSSWWTDSCHFESVSRSLLSFARTTILIYPWILYNNTWSYRSSPVAMPYPKDFALIWDSLTWRIVNNTPIRQSLFAIIYHYCMFQHYSLTALQLIVFIYNASFLVDSKMVSAILTLGSDKYYYR